jgi:hypothetical protein
MPELHFILGTALGFAAIADCAALGMRLALAAGAVLLLGSLDIA